MGPQHNFFRMFFYSIMGTYGSAYVHTDICAYHFQSKYRQRSLSTRQIRMHLWRYIAGIAEQNGFPALAVGGYDDHCHVIAEIPATILLWKAVQKIKGVSSKWLSDTYPELKDFQWQGGYAAYSVTSSQVKRVVEYIERQEEHHQRTSFQDEYICIFKG